MGGLQQAINAVVNKDPPLAVGTTWWALRSTCGYTDDELVAQVMLLGAEIERPEARTGFWGIKGSDIQTYNVGVLCWRWLMDNHKFVLENEYAARIRSGEEAAESNIEVDSGTTAS